MSTTTSASSSSSNPKPTKVIDSHLHIWASEAESAQYPHAPEQTPPRSLINKSSCSELLKQMENAGVDGALIVQPINHKFDHSYVASAIQSHPDKLKGMLLHDPTLTPDQAISRLEELALKGFVGVRFNPYLWTDGKLMSDKDCGGISVFRRCAELKMPVGIMCFKGLELHFDDIVQLIESSPETMVVLDHFGFAGLDKPSNKAFEQLLSLAKYPNVVVKISALFRIAGAGTGGKNEDPFPYEGVRRKRFAPLLETFGSDRLMFGTDFPFVLEQARSYGGTVKLVKLWCSDAKDRSAVMHGTAERLFGVWGSTD